MSVGVLRVVQLNMDSIFGPRWPERRVEVVRWLEDLKPDLVCLQEVWEDRRRPNTAGWVAEHLSETWYVAFEGFALPDPEATGAHPSVRFGSAILSRWPIDTVELMAMPINPDEEDRPHVTMRVPFVPVGVPYELLHARTGGIDVYSTHLHSGTGRRPNVWSRRCSSTTRSLEPVTPRRRCHRCCVGTSTPNRNPT